MFNNKVIGIDIGSSNIKIVAGKPKGKGISIVDYGMCSTPLGSYSDGNIIDKRDIIKSISELMNKGNFKSKKLIFGVKGSDIITRNIEMPAMSDNELKQAVKFEIQQYLPMDLNEYVIDTKRLGYVEGKKLVKVLLAAAPKRKIYDYLYVADKLNLKLKAIDLFANSVTRFWAPRNAKDDMGTVYNCAALINIGYQSSTVTLIENGKLFLDKELYMGVKSIDDILKQVFAVSNEKIEKIKNDIIMLNQYQSEKDDPRILYVNNRVRQLIDSFIDEIIKVFDFYTSRGFNKNIDSLYLCGGGSMLNGLVEYINSSINIKCRVVDVDLLPNIYNIDDNLKSNIALYVNCISLLLRKG